MTHSGSRKAGAVPLGARKGAGEYEPEPAATIFGVFCIASLVQVFFTYHETKGRSLEEISALFESGVSPFAKAPPAEALAHVSASNKKVESDGESTASHHVHDEKMA